MLALILSTAVLATIITGCAKKKDSPAMETMSSGIAGSDVFVSDTQEMALPFWISRGELGRILVHVDSRDDFRAISDETLAPLKEAARSKNATAAAALSDNTGQSGSYSEDNFVYAATRAGIVDEYVWIVPGPRGTSGPDAWKQWMTEHGYPAADIATFQGEPTHVSGTLLGVKTTITTLDRFVAPPEPVLLDIDADFIPDYGASLGTQNPLFGARSLLLALNDKKLAVRAATVTSSANRDYMPLNHRWLADVVSESLISPSILTRDTPPERWGLMGQAIEAESTDMVQAEDLWRSATSASPNDPATWYGLGRVLLISGRADDGVKAVSEAVRLDTSYSIGWLQLAAAVAPTQADVALGLADRAKGRVNEFTYRMRRGDVLFFLKRYAQAAKVYKSLSDEYRQHPDAWIRLGITRIALGDKQGGRSALTKGLALLDASSTRDVADYPTALPELGALAESQGERETAAKYYRLYQSLLPSGKDSKRVSDRLKALGL